ncbi:hypothetical protein BGZ79_008211 [Entomortierella chlamydospora]|nr:hypothetical protein BGZ79_008211 [Entomortierella chlamydospora]
MAGSKPSVHPNINRLLESSQPRHDAIARTSEINVLLLGETHSGKSTFIEFVKKYADPNHTIDLKNIGDSVTSCTNDVIRSAIHTNLPISKVVKDGQGSNPTTISLGSLIKDSPDVDDFEDALNQRNIKIIQAPSSEAPQLHQFNLFDTPGLNDTRGSGRDEEHIENIYKALRKAGRIHLVLITIGKGPFSPRFQAAIKCYFDMFPEFHGLLAFVHTHFDYKDLHPQQEEVLSRFTEKKEALNKMMGRHTCQHFVIDCDIESTKPIRIGITQNIIRNILSLAPFNQPVAMNKALILKSPKMKVTDNILVDKYRAIQDAQRTTLDSKDGTQGAILRKLYEMETQLNSLRSEKHDLEEYIKEHNTSDFVMIHKSRLDESWGLFQLHHSMAFSKHEHIIHKRNIFSEKVDISEEQGDEGHSYWRMVCRRHGYKDGTLLAKLYTTRSSIYSKQISERKSQLIQLRNDLQRVEQDRFQYLSKHQSEMADIQKLVERNALYTQLIFRLSSERLLPEVFRHLINKKAYASMKLVTVEKVCLEIIDKDGTKPSDPGDQNGELKLVKTSRLVPEVEFVKKYADPDYTIDSSNIASSISSHSEEVIHSTIHTDLPIVSVVENASGSSPIEVYLGSLIKDWPDFDDFEDLNDTTQGDEVHMASIYQALRRANDISLVLITVGMTPFTPGFQAVIKCYFDTFPGLHRLTAFVHTHVNYQDLHPSREKSVLRLATRIEQLNDLMKGDSCSHFVIDCDLKTTSAIRTCITQNTIRNILYLAPLNEPVAVNRIQIYKSSKIKYTDSILVEKYKSIVDGMSMSQRFKDSQEARLDELRSEERDFGEHTKEHNTSDQTMIYELSFDEKWKIFHHSKIHYMEFPDQERVIRKKSIPCNNLKIVEEQGGEGQSYWKIEFRRHSFKNGFLHAKLYTTKITQAAPNWLYTRLISRLSDEKLRPEVFQKLVDEEAYALSPYENLGAVERVYLDIVQRGETELSGRSDAKLR